MSKQTKASKKTDRKTKSSSCAKNFMLCKIMRNHPFYAQYADFYQTIAKDELSALRNEKNNISYNK
jgi:hypothetical protein